MRVEPPICKVPTWEETQAGTPHDDQMIHEHYKDERFLVIYDVPALPTQHEPHMPPETIEKPTFTEEFEPGYRTGYNFF